MGRLALCCGVVGAPAGMLVPLMVQAPLAARAPAPHPVPWSPSTSGRLSRGTGSWLTRTAIRPVTLADLVAMPPIVHSTERLISNAGSLAHLDGTIGRPRELGPRGGGHGPRPGQ
jgi:hypothetical protein